MGNEKDHEQCSAGSQSELLTDIGVMRTRLADIIVDCGNRGMDALLSRYADFDEVFAECEKVIRAVPQAVGEPSPCAYTGYVAQGDENVLVRIWGFGRPDASVKDVRLLYSFPPPIAREPIARAIADAYSDWAWEKEGTPVGLMLPNESARAGFFAGAKWACSVSRPK